MFVASSSIGGLKSDALWWLSKRKDVLERGRERFHAADMRYSILDLMSQADLTLEFGRMHDLHFQIDSVQVRNVLLGRKHVAL